MRTLSRLAVCVSMLATTAGYLLAAAAQPMIGDAAPAFELRSLSGERVSLADYRGKALVIHFGAGWWPFCNAEAPHLEKLWNDYKDRNVGVLVIDVLESEADTRKYAERSKFTFPVLLDSDGDVAARYAPADVLPELPRNQVPIASNLIIDPEGGIAFYSLLDSVNFDAKLIALKARLEEILSKPWSRATRQPPRQLDRIDFALRSMPRTDVLLNP